MATEEDDVGPGDRVTGLSVAALDCTAVPAIADRLHQLRRQLTTWAATTGMATALIDQLVLAVDEAMSNAVSHAYDGDRPGTFDLRATYDLDQNVVRVTVRDHGRWQSRQHTPDLLGGRGLILIRALAHDVTIERDSTGTTVQMTWHLA